jgi:peptide/nickel transport system substrate-binding protein
VDAWIEAARRAPDRAERARLYRRVERAVHDDAPWVVVASWNQSIVARADVRGFRAQPSFFLDLRHARKAEASSEDAAPASSDAAPASADDAAEGP